MIRRPPRSTLDRSSAASDVYKRQGSRGRLRVGVGEGAQLEAGAAARLRGVALLGPGAVSYTHLRAHETGLELVCRLLLENKKRHSTRDNII